MMMMMITPPCTVVSAFLLSSSLTKSSLACAAAKCRAVLLSYTHARISNTPSKFNSTGTIRDFQDNFATPRLLLIFASRINSRLTILVLSSRHSICDNSPGSFDKHRLRANPQTRPTDLDCKSASKLLPSAPSIAIYYYYYYYPAFVF